MFTIGESLKYGWEKFKANLGIAIGATLVIFAVSFIGNLDNDSIILGLIATILGFIVQIGYTKIFLRMSDGESQEFSEIFKHYGLFWKYLGVSILNGLVILGGLILLVIPGIYWAVRFAFSPFIVIDTNLGPVAAMKESWAITKGKFWKLLGFMIVIGLINIAGFIALGVGLLVTAPLSTFAMIYVYRELTKAKAGLEVPSPQIVS